MSIAHADPIVAPARTTLSRTEQASLTELLRMLSHHAFEGARLIRAAVHVQQAGCDPELLELGGSAVFIAYARASELAELMAASECLPELHDQLSDLLARPLPPLPSADAGPAGYFHWLDAQLAERHREWGGLAALGLELGVDARMRLLLVHRRRKATRTSIQVLLHCPCSGRQQAIEVQKAVNATFRFTARIRVQGKASAEVLDKQILLSQPRRYQCLH